MSGSLKGKTIKALLWSFIESVGLISVKFIVGIILARILFPEQFGLIGMLTIFMAVAQVFLDSGFGSALIQKQNATQTDYCSIFYFNIGAGFLIVLIFYSAAPWIAAFYGQPILTPLTRFMSLAIVINAFGLIQNTILIKELNFKKYSYVSLLASSVSGIIGISFAVNGYGVWSLVAQQMSAAFFRTIFLWFICTWRPSLIFSFKSLSQLFGFGSKMLAAGLLNQIFNHIYLLVIGRLFSASHLGFYTRAKTLAEVPSTIIPRMVGRVLFPAFSKIQENPERLKKAMRKALKTIGLVYFPLMIGLAAIAPSLVLLLLTAKWAESIPYLQLLCFAWLLFPVHLINLNLLQSMGRSDLFLRIEIIKKVLIAANICITWRWGIPAMIGGMIVTSLCAYILNSYYTYGLIGYSIGEQLNDLIPTLVLSLIMGVAVYLIGMVSLPGLWCTIILQIFIGSSLYIFLCRLLCLSAFMELWASCWDKISQLKFESKS